MNKKIKYIIIVVFLLLFLTVVYANNIANERKSIHLPWQGTAEEYFDNIHNVGLSYKAENRFINIGNIVIDNITNLQWQKNQPTQNSCKIYDVDNYVNNQFYVGDNASYCNFDNTGETCNWCAAMEYCKNLNIDGKDDWRLPNIKELSSIIDFSKTSPSLNELLAPGVVNLWSSTTSKYDNNRAWRIDFYDGRSGMNYKRGDIFVRCVR